MATHIAVHAKNILKIAHKPIYARVLVLTGVGANMAGVEMPNLQKAFVRCDDAFARVNMHRFMRAEELHMCTSLFLSDKLIVNTLLREERLPKIFWANPFFDMEKETSNLEKEMSNLADALLANNAKASIDHVLDSIVVYSESDFMDEMNKAEKNLVPPETG